MMTTTTRAPPPAKINNMESSGCVDGEMPVLVVVVVEAVPVVVVLVDVVSVVVVVVVVVVEVVTGSETDTGTSRLVPTMLCFPAAQRRIVQEPAAEGVSVTDTVTWSDVGLRSDAVPSTTANSV
jgi:hypothetical protein